MSRWVSLALIAAIVLASCASEPPDVDWCYTYDLTVAMPSGAVITSGEWIPGVGLAADETGELIVSFTEAFYIEPQYFRLWAVRLDDPGDITVSASVSVFGLDRVIGETIPAGIDEAPLLREREGSDPLTAGNTVSATMQTTAALAISALDVGGYGASPFSTNLCGPDAPTNTPEPATDTPDPDPTSTPTITLTPSITPTPSNTPIPTWQCTWDFTAQNWGWSVSRGTYSAGNGWIAGDGSNSSPLGGTGFDRAVAIRKFFTATTVQQISITFDRTIGTVEGGAFTRRISHNSYNDTMQVDGSTASGNQTFTWTGSQMMDAVHFYIRSSYRSTASYSGSVTVRSIYMAGTGSSQLCEALWTPTPTLTTTPTRTPTVTATINLTHSLTPTRTAIIGGGTGTPSRTPTRTLIAVATWTPGPTNTPQPTLPPPTAPPPVVTATPVTYTPEFTYTPLPTGTDGSPGGTPWTTPTVGMGTPWGTPDGWGDGGVDGDDIIPWLQTAAAEVNTLPGSLDPYVPDPDTTEFLGYAKWMISCVSLQELLGTTLSVPACHVIAGLTLMFVMSSAFFSIRIIRAVFGVARFLFGLMVTGVNMMLTVVTGLLSMSPLVAIAVAVGVAASAFLAMQIDEVEQFVSDVIEIISLIVQIIVGLFVTVISWMFFAVGLVVAIIQSFFTSTPLAIPGFPQCVTNPTGHDICAAWYMLDHTLLSGSVGALIVLIVIVIVDVTVVFWAVRKVLTIVNSAESITSGAS